LRNGRKSPACPCTRNLLHSDKRCHQAPESFPGGSAWLSPRFAQARAPGRPVHERVSRRRRGAPRKLAEQKKRVASAAQNRASIDVQDFSGDERREVRCKEEN